MKSLLVIAFLGAGIFVSACNAACLFTGPRGHGDPGGCVVDGVTHAYGSSWRTAECLDCDCYADGSTRCCDNVGRPVNYNQEKCMVIFDKEACVSTVVRKNDPSKICKHGRVG
ncbi:beta-microseminoprotein-like [Dendropsophus ebraccatus]|uniref:beta-microseminoprotein-like n=1 Tax=Dendropsophus ebraccatus TaxID=150705 RepID=UPI0038315879